ncbi:MAG: ABC transporter substrate-binding protein [Myxococcota bacterium]|nr:ABC transporter substrate-binding protein [Myxococcota bacterium]
MSIKKAISMGIVLGFATLAAAVKVQFYDESLPESLNPLYAESMVDFRAQELYFDRLYYNDPIDNKLTSKIVKRWELQSPTAIKLYLNEGLKWHNGEDLTAKDICFTINAIKDKKTTSKRAKAYRKSFKSCSVEKPLIAELEFSSVYYKPIARLNFAVLPKSEFGGKTAILPNTPFSSRPVGSGPMSGAKGTQNASFKAHRTSSHHKPKIDKMQLNQAQDPQVQIATIRNGNVHGIISVAPPFRPELSTSSEVVLKTYDLRSWWFIALNQNEGILNKKEVRQALNLLIDRNELREKSIGVKKGDKESPCELISGPFVQSSPYYNRTVPVVENRREAEARALLNRAGLEKKGRFWHYNGQPIMLRIGMKESLNKEAPDLLNQIGNQLGEAGFDRRVYKISAEDWTREVTTGSAISKYDMVIGKWSFNIDENVNNLFQTRSANKGTRNIFNYSNPEVDAILERFDDSRTVSDAKNAYHDLHAKLDEELPYLFLWKLDTKSAWRKEIRSNIIAPYYYFTMIDDWKYSAN